MTGGAPIMRINLLIAVVAAMVATPLFAAETTTPQSNALSSQGPGTGTAGQPGSKGHPTLTEDGNANLQPGNIAEGQHSPIGVPAKPDSKSGSAVAPP
jgi:hypothetical protein